MLAVLLSLPALPGCAFGPRALEKTHGRYGEAVHQVDEEQLLRNIVRARYLESPENLDVSSITTQYELSASAEARPFFLAPNPAGSVFRTFTALLPGASISGSDRPTVSLIPQNEGSAVRRFMTPISAESLVFLGQAGWPVSHYLGIWVDRMNGVPNRPACVGPPREAPADFARFQRAVHLMQLAQDQEWLAVQAEDRTTEVSGPLPAAAVTAAAVVEAARDGFEYRPREDGSTWVLVRRGRQLVLDVLPAGQDAPEVAELTALLNLQPGLPRYEIAVAAGVPDPARSPAPPSPVLRLALRSTAQAIFYLADGVEVPASPTSPAGWSAPPTARLPARPPRASSGSTAARATSTGRRPAPMSPCATGTTGITSTTATRPANRPCS